MNPCEEYRSILDSYVDGELDGLAGRRLEEHLRTCSECRRHHRQIVEVLRAAADLTREIEPVRDLWPAISARIQGGNVLSLRRKTVRRVAVAAALVAAAVVALVILPRGPASPRVADHGPAGSGVRPAVSSVEPSFNELGELDRATQDLKRVLEERKTDLSPETQRVIDENLEVIDQAIANVKRALGEDPNNQALTVLLTATYQRKIELLKLATEASRRT